MSNTKSQYGSSSFWMSNRDDRVIKRNMSSKQAEVYDLYKLASQKRAISNFVSILTGDRIPVTFHTDGDSYTDGKRIVISSSLQNPKDFDVACGLALHEGSHIVLSDFELLKNLKTVLERRGDYHRQNERCDDRNIPYLYTLKSILNYIEDRRIDKYIYSRAPGYRAYYHAMYDKYFNDRIIEKALKTSEYTDETIESYMFRIINLHSRNSRLDALNGLREIYSIIDFHNIDRLKNSDDALSVAINVVDVMLSHIPQVPQDSEESDESTPTPSPQSEDGDEIESRGGHLPSDETDETDSKSDGDNQDEDEESESNGNGSDDDQEGDESESNGSSSGDNTDNEDEEEDDSDSNDDVDDEEIELTERQKRIIGKRIEKQRKFLDGNVSKTKISKTQQREIEIIDETDSEIVNVGENYDYYSKTGVKCVVVKEMTRNYCESDEFPFSSWTRSIEKTDEDVTRGIQLGTILGKKLKTHSESRTTHFTRQKTGKIDKRLIASLGFSNPSVFYRSETDQYNDVNLHMSIDASSSMGGEKWKKTMINTVAIIKACDMIENINVQVSFRGTISKNNKWSKSLPVIMIAYDSRRDSFRKVRNLFKYINPSGTTPEGLCFEAIEKLIVESSNNLDSYFLNISDGMPQFENSDIDYYGTPACKHTRKQVDSMMRRGLKVLSYFVSNGGGSGQRGFSESYGKTAKYIDVTNMNQVGQTMNKLFLEK